MTARVLQSPLPTFNDLNGNPLTSGYVYFGASSTDPRQSPATVYWDAAKTLVAPQPLRTTSGYIVRNGAPADVWVDGAVSILALDSYQRQVLYVAEWVGVADAAAAAASEWAIKTDAPVSGADFSAKEYAQGTQASTGGSSKNWSQQTGAEVTGAAVGSRSSKSWAQEDLTSGGYGGSAKDWAQSASLPDGISKSAKSYAADASGSATAAAASAAASASAASAAATAGAYPNGAATVVPRGLTQASVGAITGGSGGTNGTFSASFSGGNFTINPSATFTVSGGALTAFTVTGPGLCLNGSPTVPTVSFAASAGLTGAAVALTAQLLVTAGQGYWVTSADGKKLDRYKNVGGVATADPSVGSLYLTPVIDAVKVKQVTERNSPETTLRNIFTNGDFAQGTTGYGGTVTYTPNASGGCNLKVGSLAARFFDGPTLSYTYAVGNRFLLLYSFDYVTHVDGNVVFYLETPANASISNAATVTYTGATSYTGSALVAITSGSGTQLRVSGEFDTVTANNEIWLKYCMLVPLDGALTGYTQAQALAEIAARGMTGKYFEPGGAAMLSVLARRADVATTIDDGAVTLAKLETALQDISLTNYITQPNLTLGQQNWTESNSGGATLIWTGSGAQFSVTAAGNGSSVQLQIFSNTAPTLTAGHRYAFFADMDLAGNGETSNLDTASFHPSVNSTSGITYGSLAVKVGRSGSSITSRACTTFDVTSTQTAGNIYFSLGAPCKEPGGAVVNTFTMTATVRTFMLVDLGVSTDSSYGLGVSDLGEVLIRSGAPYYPAPSPKVMRSFSAVRSVYSVHATLADRATLADTATLAETVRSPWEGKRMGTFGHSLVSQAGWQGNTYNYLNLGGYNYLGITGGTVQPSPGNMAVAPGFWSRAYWANAVINALGVNRGANTSNGLAGQIMDCVILWAGANDGIKNYGPGAKLLLDHAQVISVLGTTIANASGGDRMMTTAEQNEYEAAVGASLSADPSAPLSTGLVPTYKTLWLTMWKNMITALAPYVKADSTRFFIVREPQCFQIYDGTLDWDKGHYEKNEIHRQVADMLGVPLINLFGEGIGFWNRTVFLQNEDGGNLWVHQNEKGGLLHGRHIAQTMLRYPPLDYTGKFGASTFQIPTAQGDQSPWIVDNL